MSKPNRYNPNIPYIGYIFSTLCLLYVLYYIFITYFGIKEIDHPLELQGKNYSVIYYIDVCKQSIDKCTQPEKMKATILAKPTCVMGHNDLLCYYTREYYLSDIIMNDGTIIKPEESCMLKANYIKIDRYIDCAISRSKQQVTQQIDSPSSGYHIEEYMRPVEKEWMIRLTNMKVK